MNAKPASQPVPWCWAGDRHAEFWQPAGRSRADSIAEGRRRWPQARPFWIAPAMRYTADDADELPSTWLVDSAKTECILPTVLPSTN